MHEPEQIVDGVYLVGGQDLTDARDCCVYLIDGGGEVFLVQCQGRAELVHRRQSRSFL